MTGTWRSWVLVASLFLAGAAPAVAQSTTGTITGRAYYVRVTTAGTLTSVSAVTTASNNNYVFNAVAYAGPFLSSPLDQAPANNTGDVTSPFTCPATGTLTQADELVVCWGNRTGNASTAWSATCRGSRAGRSRRSTASICSFWARRMIRPADSRLWESPSFQGDIVPAAVSCDTGAGLCWRPDSVASRTVEEIGLRRFE